MDETRMQRQIEMSVTEGRKYDRRNTAKTPASLRDTEVGLQIALANMDIVGDRINWWDAIDIVPRITAMLTKFEKAGIPIEVITDANGFKEAFDSVYCSSQPSYLGTYYPDEDVTRGISEYGPWAQPGKRRLSDIPGAFDTSALHNL